MGFQGLYQVRIHRAAFHGFVLAEHVHGAHQFHILLLQDRLYHCMPHSAQGTVYHHFDHSVHLSFVDPLGDKKAGHRGEPNDLQEKKPLLPWQGTWFRSH